MNFALDQLRRLDLSQVNADVWQILLLHPLSQATITDWFDEDVLSAATLDMSYWHALAYEPDWQVSEYIERLKSADTSIKNWQKHLAFDEYLAENVRDWLSDVRRFAPIDLGFDWLMNLAHSEQALYREFAIERINKGSCLPTLSHISTAMKATLLITLPVIALTIKTQIAMLLLK